MFRDLKNWLSMPDRLRVATFFCIFLYIETRRPPENLRMVWTGWNDIFKQLHEYIIILKQLNLVRVES